jgi:YD repeat-containing protein
LPFLEELRVSLPLSDHYRFHRTTSITTPSGSQSFGLDDFGRTTSVTANNTTVSYNYNYLSQLENVVDPVVGTTSYEYNDFGQTKKVTEPLNITREYGFDGLGRVASAVIKQNGNYQMQASQN